MSFEFTGDSGDGSEPDYAAATAVARIAVLLLESPTNSVSVARLQEVERIDVSERTLYRYAQLLRRAFPESQGWPRVMVSRTPDGQFVRFASRRIAKVPKARDLFSLYLAQAALVGLQGTVLREDVAMLWKGLCDSRDTLTPEQRARLKDIPRKIFVVPRVIKKYGKLDSIVNALLRAVIDQHRMRIGSLGRRGQGAEELDPYSIVMDRGGLYVVGHSFLRRKIVWMPLERIRSVDSVIGDDGEPIHFAYPRSYSPEKHLVDPDLVDFIVEDYAKQRAVRPALFAWSPKKFFLIRYLDRDPEFLQALRTVFAHKGVTRCCAAMPGSIGEPTKDRRTFLLFAMQRGVRDPDLHVARVVPAENGRAATVQVLESDEMASGDFCDFLLDRKPRRADLANAMDVINDRRARPARFIIQGL